MPVIIIIGILAVYGVWWIYDKLTTNTRAFTNEELEQMGKEMVGRSQSQCRAIIKKYENKK